MFLGSSPVLVFVCLSVSSWIYSLPLCGSSPSLISPHLRLWVSFPVLIPRCVVHISHMELIKEYPLWSPRTLFSYIFCRCSSCRTSAALGLFPRPKLFSCCCLLLRVFLDFSNSMSLMMQIFEFFFLSGIYQGSL